MPKVARIGDTVDTGHGCDSVTTLTGPSVNVFANNLGVEREDDPTVSHSFAGEYCEITHTAKVNVGFNKVFVNNKPIARKDDSADQGTITSGSDNVFAG